ncbi:hypothetical protein N8I77_010196 [Diaporthe amygdali]|uniref:Transcription factor domain-containing protein n=1 Tax=Phomopsis amygdali TaxID=1214568 RepID=A0AAD9S7U3_PHOAM|nr:hypothetical protein N8I77_010196 [Diaporthe amygdali]
MNNHVPPAHMPMHDAMEPTPFMPDVIGPNASLIEPISDDMVYFNPMSNFLQDMDFTMSWDMNFDAFSIPQFDLQGPSPQSSSTNAVTKPSPRNTVRDSSRGHSAFKRSPWLWDPKKEDYVQQQKEALHIDEQSISQSPAFGKLMDRPSRRLKMTAHQRDRIFSIVLAQNKDPAKVPSFPTLDLLNYLMQAHFVQDEHQFDSWIHPPSFNPENALPELLAAIISSGASFISVPAIWQFGLAMHEVVRLGVSDLFEKLNIHTRNLSALQTFMLTLDVGIWSGFKRKMEIAESFLQPLLTMLRRAGAFSAPADSPALVPLDSDSPEALETKWKKFISRESYKSLPASRDLWCAPTAEAWRQVHHSKTTMPRPLPRVSEVLHCVDVLDELEEFIDIDLCYSAVLNGYWGQVWAYREGVRFFATANRGGTNRLWLKSQHQELYQDLLGFSSIIHTSNTPRNHSTLLAIVVELFLMIMHVSPDEIQRFAGKLGEEESRRAGVSLEENWANTSDARYAIWHAGQVFANAKRLPPASLRGFNAIAVYLASMTLWTYGLFCSPAPQGGDDLETGYLQPGEGQQANTGNRRASSVPGGGPTKYVLLDEEETRDTKAFLQFDRGVPALKTSQGAVEPLSDPSKILSIARNLFRENYPVRTEPLPPLVESLGNLLRDLGSGLAGMPSRVASRVQSRVVSRMGSEEP